MTNQITNKQNEIVSNDLKEAVNTYFETLTEGLTDTQKKQFQMLCLANKLNPILGQVYAIKFGDKFNIVTNYYEYLKKADQTGLLEYQNIDIESEKDPVTGREMPKKATFTGKRKDQTQEMKLTIYFREFTSGKSTWLTKPFFMIDKCCLANGLRRLFPNELGNMPYVNEELWYFNKHNEEIVMDHIRKDDVKEIEAPQIDSILKKVRKANEAK